MNRCLLGIDPGLTGALAFYFTDHPTRVSVIDMPVADKRVCGATLTAHLEQLRPDLVIVEQVGARPEERTAQRSFNFGASYGVLIGVIQALKIPHRLVVPGKWKRHFGLDADKEKSRAMALRTFTDTPEHFGRKKDEGRAEAALIALYGAQALSLTISEAA